MRDFDIIIAHRGEPMGLWATIHSCEIELARSKYSYKYILCVNGEETSKNKFDSPYGKMNVDLARIIEFCEKSGKLGHVTVLQESISPPTARQICTEFSDSKYLFFFDNHCLVARQYFDRAMYDFMKYDMDVLHSTTKFYEGGDENLSYEYRLKLEHNFWAESFNHCKDQYKPYQIAAGGHGGFAVKAETWREVGGYWKGFNGYGGEEMYLDLKMALLGKTNYIDPLMIHYHYAGQRGYARHYSSDYYKNMLMCANIIGGTAWMDKVYESFTKNFLEPKNKDFFSIYMEAHEDSKDHAAELAASRHRTLDEQIKLFRHNDISC